MELWGSRAEVFPKLQNAVFYVSAWNAECHTYVALEFEQITVPIKGIRSKVSLERSRKPVFIIPVPFEKGTD